MRGGGDETDRDEMHGELETEWTMKKLGAVVEEERDEITTTDDGVMTRVKVEVVKIGGGEEPCLDDISPDGPFTTPNTDNIKHLLGLDCQKFIFWMLRASL